MTATPDSTYNSFYGTTAVAPYTSIANPAITPSTSSTYWFAVLTKNGLHLGPNTQNGYGHTFAGLFESFWSTLTTDFPLVVQGTSATGLAGASLARLPGVSGSSANFTLYAPTPYGLRDGIIGGTNYPGYGGGSLQTRAVVYAYVSGVNPGIYRGMMYDTLYCLVDATVVVGDTITYNGNSWVVVSKFGSSSSSNALLVNTAAA